MRPAISLAFLLLWCSAGVAQTVDAPLLGQSVDLGSAWFFHPGDDLRWAQPGYQDSKWTVISTDVGPYARTNAPNGYFWYRLHVHIPPEHPNLMLIIDESGNPYQVFVNGVAVGQFGSFPPKPVRMRNLIRQYSIPSYAAAGDSLVIALRFWNRDNDWGGLRGMGPVELGSVEDMGNMYRAVQSRTVSFWLPDMCVRFLSFALAAGLLILYWWNREFTEYLWIAGYFLAMTAWTAFIDFRTIGEVSLPVSEVLDLVLTDVASVLLLQFAFAFLKRPMPLWLRVYQLSLLGQVILIYVGARGWASGSTLDFIGLLWTLPYVFLLPGIVFWRYLQGQKEAGLLALPLLLINFNDILGNIGWLLYEVRMRKSAAELIPPLHIGPVPVYIGELEGLLFVLSIGALLLYRFHRTTQERARVQSELEAARSMQEVMVPKRLHEACGFAIESAYIPAQEVGGDFFQLYPGTDGSLLAVIGDVSGKGVKAAMLVSMILGVLQRSVDFTRSPAQVLRDLNRCVMGQTDGKFATCCCALLLADGKVIASNAGHLSPYCDGEEIPLPGGLPLGLSPDADYEEVELHLRAGKRWLFISDGVVEARNKTGEIYGFDRTRSISILTVNQIAEKAQEFGQEDDITVLGIERQAVAFA